ncbi:flagellar transcriptional regulator FlhD [Achromobacter mucicolens]|uniref:flagellar transcriptional regulator FlhD n=1 Tax=Achromobacter mucicolens TaxID=1389922 RepID=UPI0009BF0C0C|nr:flagellar transcriptional regulator FlhD [Achromobacter mucicolens]
MTSRPDTRRPHYKPDRSTLDHIYELNLHYLLLVRRVVKEEVGNLSRLAISPEAAHWIGAQTTERLERLARCSFLICRMTVSTSEILLALARSQPAESVLAARTANELLA